jgi:DNA-binding beta-propeller fold protein YncE
MNNKRVIAWALAACLLSLSLQEVLAKEPGQWEVLPAEELFVLKGSPNMPFRQPTDVAVDPEHRIFVMDGLNSRVVVFDAEGGYLYSFGARGSAPGEMLMPVGMGISPSGEVFVADTGNHRIQVFSPAGGFQRLFPLVTEEKGDPTDVLPSSFNNLCYVCDNDNHQVQVYDATSGQYVAGWGGKGKNLGEFRYPATLAMDSGNNLYVVDVMNARVQTFDPHGERAWEVAVWGVSLDRLFRPKGVAIDGSKRILVSDSYAGIIKVFLPGGDLFGFVGDAKGETRRFTTPTNIVLDPRGRLLVVETRASQVSVYRIKK